MTPIKKPQLTNRAISELFPPLRVPWPRLPIGPTRWRFNAAPRPRPWLPVEDKPGGCPPIRTA